MKRTCKIYIRHRGFTMIEMVIVLIVMVIVATFILVRATPGSNDLIAQGLRWVKLLVMNPRVEARQKELVRSRGR